MTLGVHYNRAGEKPPDYCPVCGAHEDEWGEGKSVLRIYVVVRPGYAEGHSVAVNVFLSLDDADNWIARQKNPRSFLIQEVKDGQCICEGPSAAAPG